MKTDGGFAARDMRAVGWQLFGCAKALSLSRRRSLCGMLGIEEFNAYGKDV
jgi:hypothetical protein